MDRPRTNSTASHHLPWLLLSLAVIYYVAGVLTMATHRRGEVEPLVFARLLATGHMAEFVKIEQQRLPPADQWVQAREWQRFERLEGRGVWRTIAQDAGKYEAHPPFFFWLMHAALLAGVPDHWLTTVINLPAALLIGGLIVGFTAWLSRDRWCAALAGVCWFLSPPVMWIGDGVRSPTLFALIALLYLWLTVDWARQTSPKWLWRMGLTIVLAVIGVLNHFQMAIVIAACGLYLLWRIRWRCWPMAMGVAIAVGVFLLIDPYAIGSFDFEKSVNTYEPMTVRSTLVRFLNVGIGLVHFFALEPKWTRAMTLVIPLTLLAAMVWHWRQGGLQWFKAGRLREFACLTAVLLVLDTVMYVSRQLPYHGYGVYYFPGLIVVTPVWVGIGTQWLLTGRAAAGRWVLLTVLLVSSVASATRWLIIYRDAGVAVDVLATADVIFCDAVNIRGIPRVVDEVPPTTWVRTATRVEMPALIDTALRKGKRVALAPDATYDINTRPDAYDAYLADAIEKGVFKQYPGTDWISPNFKVFGPP